MEKDEWTNADDSVCPELAAVFSDGNEDRDSDKLESGKKSELNEKKKDKKVKKGRRGRPPKDKGKPISDIPEEIVKGLSEEVAKEMECSYNIYQAIKNTRKISPFLHKPDSSMFGMSAYFSLIQKPMWLNEIERKLYAREYGSLCDFLADLRTMLENCYRYWGPSHYLSRKGLVIEKRIEVRILSLSESMKAKCKNSFFPPKDDTQDEDSALSNDVNQSSDDSNDRVNCLLNSHSKYDSKILHYVLETKKHNGSFNTVNKSKQWAIVEWENNILMSEQYKNDIRTTWELAAVGLFLKGAHEALNVHEVSQYEVERMFLMPRESTTLATLMTSMLSTSTSRWKLDATVPTMTYEIWNSRLKHKVSSWFSSFFNSKGDETAAFESCGIEPLFWTSVCLMNPYENQDFHEMSFTEKIMIFKALCDNIYHASKNVKGAFPLKTSGGGVSKETEEHQLGIHNGSMYYYLPFWPFIRVYKQKVLPESTWEGVKDTGITTLGLLEKSVSVSNKEGLEHPVIAEFELVADSVAELENLLQTFDKSNGDLYGNLNEYYNEMKCLQHNWDAQVSMYDQWHEFHNRTEDQNNRLNESQKKSFAYYVTRADSCSEEPKEVLGKRKRKINTPMTDMASSESEQDFFDFLGEEDADAGSDWECPSEKKKYKKSMKAEGQENKNSESGENAKIKVKRQTKKSKKKALTPTITTAVGVSGSSKCSIVLQNVHSIAKEDGEELKVDTNIVKTEPIDELEKVTIKKEPEEEEKVKDYPNLDKIKIEVNTEPENDKEKKDTVAEEPTKPVEIKTEKSEVITLSSDEDDLIITTPVKQIKRNIAPEVVNNNNNSNKNNVIKSPINRSPMQNSPIRNQLMRSPMSPRTPQRNINLMTRSPLQRSPLQRSPLQRNPNSTSPQVRAMAARSQLFYSPGRSPRGMAMNTSPRLNSSPQNSPRIRNPNPSRNLFNNSPRQQTAPPGFILATVAFGRHDDGTQGFIARLPDQGIINLSSQEVEDIKKRNNGLIPPTIHVPLRRNTANSPNKPTVPLKRY